MDEALAVLQQEVVGRQAPGLYTHLGALHLAAGYVMDALEACLAEEATPDGEPILLIDALREHFPRGIKFEGAWGTSPSLPVVIAGDVPMEARVCAAHRFVEFALGQPVRDWRLDRACVAIIGGRVLDILQIISASGEPLSMFFALEDTQCARDQSDQVLAYVAPTEGGDIVAGEVMGPVSRRCTVELNPESTAIGLAGLEKAMLHLSQHLITIGTRAPDVEFWRRRSG
jgi:hypothetical protein